MLMDNLINYLRKFGHLNQQQIELLKRKAVEKEIKKILITKKQEKFQEKLFSWPKAFLEFATTTIKAMKSRNILLTKIILWWI